MQIDFSKYITELLFLNPRVIIPGLGAFESQYQESSIDFVQGEILPPSSQLVFNETVSQDDGILTSYIVQKTGFSVGEVLSTYSSFIDDIKSALDKKEMVAFPSIGRIYKNFEDKIQFLPENTNFNTEMYGLPQIQYYPILRSKEQFIAKKEAEAEKLAVVHKQKSARFDTQKWMKAAMPYAAAAILGFFFIKYALTEKTTTLTGPKKELVSEKKLNQHAGFSSKEIDEAIAETENPSSQSSKLYSQGIGTIDEEDSTESLDTESATPLRNQKEAIIIVHSFGNRKNVKRMIKKLSKMGFTPYTDKFKGLTRVGIQFSYDEKSQLQKNLHILRKRINKGAFLVK